jgi:hypothetical protein
MVKGEFGKTIDSNDAWLKIYDLDNSEQTLVDDTSLNYLKFETGTTGWEACTCCLLGLCVCLLWCLFVVCQTAACCGHFRHFYQYFQTLTLSSIGTTGCMAGQKFSNDVVGLRTAGTKRP